MTDLKHHFRISGAYDGRSHPRNYGIGSMGLYFAVSGPKGGVSVYLSTSWYLPQNQQASFDMFTKGYPFDPLKELMQPKWWDVSQHHREPAYASQHMQANCDLLDGPCYCDGTSLWGENRWLPGFLHGGSDWLFARLEDYYREVFEGGPPVDLTPVPKTFPDGATK